MLRLFSIFPSGAPGIALLILRVSLAAAMLNALPDGRPMASLLGLILLALSALLVVGFLTPAVSVTACLFELTRLFGAGSDDWRFSLLVSLIAASMALLGPGAYSMDSRLFGRRVIVIPPAGNSAMGGMKKPFV